MRLTFARKLIAALMAVVAVQILVVGLLVRGQTGRQVGLVVDRTRAEARTTFRNLEQARWLETARFSVQLGGGPRERARMGSLAAVQNAPRDARDEVWEETRNQTLYQADLVGLDPGRLLVAYFDADGYGLWSWNGAFDAILEGDDPLSFLPALEEAWDSPEAESRRYRAYQDQLYRVYTRLLFSGATELGALTVGINLQTAEAETIRDVVGADVCFVVEGRCVVGSSGSARHERDLVAAATGPASGDEGGQDSGDEFAYVTVPVEGAENVTMALAVPLAPVVAPFRRISLALGLGSLASLLVAALLSGGLARRLTEPLRALTAATGRVAAGDLDTPVEVTSRDELGDLAASFNDMTRELRLKEQYRGVLNKVVSPDVAAELMGGKVELGGETRTLTVLFGDLRGFTPQTQNMPPQAVIELLNECMGALSAAVDAEGGVVDKFVGDEIMALFGAPVSRGDDARRAVNCAVRMQQAMENINQHRARRGQAPLRLGIGVSTGDAVVGNMGAPERLNYTAVGATVNLGARLCSAAGDGEILLSPATVEALDQGAGGPPVSGEGKNSPAGGLDIRSVGEREFKGFSDPLEVFAVNTPDRRSRPGGLSSIIVALAAAATIAGGDALHAQTGEWPTLENAGYWSSDSGYLQFALSGRLFMDGHFPSDSAPGLMRETDAFAAPRLRLFADFFIGDRILITAEGRVDRGHAPANRDFEARLEQIYAQLGPFGPLTVTAGRFISPFGSWPERHLSPDDPFIRPPLPYDFPTILADGLIPTDVDEFLTWRDTPGDLRATGLPPIWDAPYPIGLMLEFSRGDWVFKGAALNSAPAGAPYTWNWDADRLEDPNLAFSASWFASPGLRLTGWFNKGPWLFVEDGVGPGLNGPVAVTGPATYDQTIWGIGGEYTRGGTVVRAEYFSDRWDLPNVEYDPREIAWTAEIQQDLRAGLYVAARYGAIRFSNVQNSASQYLPWDDDGTRIQIAAGYRLARNAGIQAEWLNSWSGAPVEPSEDMISARLWWLF